MPKTKVIFGVFTALSLLAVTLARTEETGTSSYEPASVVSTSDPVYPAMTMGPGTVVLAVSIDADGEIQDVKVTQNSEAFKSSALDAIKKWKFKPATLNGKPVPSVVPVAMSFSWPIACYSSR